MAVVKGNYVKRNQNERTTAKANIYYIQTRPGANKEKLTRSLFGPAGFMSRYEAYQFITDAPKGTYFYRLKLSPDPNSENLKRDLNMKKLTRQMMRSLDRRLRTPIPWAGAVHDDHTNIPHCHILAAIPKRLNTYELEFLIREATRLCLLQRRFLDRGVSRLPWQREAPRRVLKTGTYTAHRYRLPDPVLRGGRPARIHHTCTCPRCHFPQTHNKHAGSHQCAACGLMLHKKRELSLQKDKGRGLERSL